MQQIIIVLILLSGCSLKVKTDPVKVEHVIKVDLDAITDFCRNQCFGETACMLDCVDKVKNFFGFGDN